MAESKVLFLAGTWEQYSSLLRKDPTALYWILDRHQIWKGDKQYSAGDIATEEIAGLMSAEDKRALNALISTGTSAPSYTLERQSVAESGAYATYKLKRTLSGTSLYVGDPINIPARRGLQSGSLMHVTTPGDPYSGAEVGDPYLNLLLDDNATHVYIPVKGLGGSVNAGNGLNLVNNLLSIKLDPVKSNGLKITADGLALDLATENLPGAMSAEDKQAIDALPAKYVAQRYAVVDSTNPLPVVKYNDGEVRIMYAEGVQWQSQQVGAGGNPDRYYMNFRVYAPKGAVKFREQSDPDAFSIPADAPVEAMEGHRFVSKDEYGRKYTSSWLPVAKRNADNTWTYFGNQSSVDKYNGWYHCTEWYDADNNLISADTIRINLSNASCHVNPLPYYMSKFATKEDLENVSGTINWKPMTES